MQRFPLLPRLSLKRGQCFLFLTLKCLKSLAQIREPLAFLDVLDCWHYVCSGGSRAIPRSPPASAKGTTPAANKLRRRVQTSVMTI